MATYKMAGAVMCLAAVMTALNGAEGIQEDWYSIVEVRQLPSLKMISEELSSSSSQTDYQRDIDTEIPASDHQPGMNLVLLKSEVATHLKLLEDLYFPFLPMFAAKGLSLSLTHVQLLGLSGLEIDWDTILNSVGNTVTVPLTLPTFTFLADPYIAGGGINTLPFVGKSDLSVTATQLGVTIQFRHGEDSKCAQPNSTVFLATIDRLQVQFSDLNPGTESGDLINTMLSGWGQDLMTLLTAALNGPLHSRADPAVVGAINAFIKGCGGQTEQGTINDDAQRLESVVKELLSLMVDRVG